MLVEKSLSLTEILSVDLATLIRRRHDQATTVIRTTIEGLGVDVLNLFPPTNRIFWSFGVFAAQDQISDSIVDSIRADALKTIRAEQKNIGVFRKSVNAYELLGAITRGQGDEYYPYADETTGVPYWWFAQRHVNLVCPTDKYEEFHAYFSTQLRQIGDDCWRDAPEDKVLVDMSQHDNKPDYDYLAKYVTRLSPAERLEARSALIDGDFLAKIDPDVSEIVGCRAGPEIGFFENLDDFDDSDCIRAILCRRVELALEFVTLLDIERMRIHLSEEPWSWNSKDRDRMLAALDERISHFPVIEMRIER